MIFANDTKKLFFGLALLYSLLITAENQKLITILGTGYVGLVSGACLADLGNQVICADIDIPKINALQQGIIPIYEQGLTEIISRNVRSGNLSFTSDVDTAIQQSDIVFIAVGTPMDHDGNANLSYLYNAIEKIASNLNSEKIIVTKSTVPIGTGKKIRDLLENKFHIDPTMFNVVSNPEFLREGVAVSDFFKPDRIVIGTESDEIFIDICQVYAPLIAAGTPCVLTDLQTAEMIKYASNAFLSVKIGYINEIANLCDKLGANVKTVAFAMGLDPRIGSEFLKPGPGFGGSCFPKDSQALVYIAKQNNVPFYIVQAALQSNDLQQKKPVEKLLQLLQKNNQFLTEKTVAILGLAFKANTDDIRYSPALNTISSLQEHNVTINAYDPIAIKNMREVFPDIHYYTNPYDALTGADAVIIMSDCDEIKQLDFKKIKSLMRQSFIVDARNATNPELLSNLGFLCDTIGQSCLCLKSSKPLFKKIPLFVQKYITPESCTQKLGKQPQ